MLDLSSLSDKEILEQIQLIEENIKECGSPSSYTHRNRPVLKVLLIEASKRGIA